MDHTLALATMVSLVMVTLAWTSTNVCVAVQLWLAQTRHSAMMMLSAQTLTAATSALARLAMPVMGSHVPM